MSCLLAQGNHLTSQVRMSVVAYCPGCYSLRQTEKRSTKTLRKKHSPQNLFDNPETMHKAKSPVYGEKESSCCTIVLWTSCSKGSAFWYALWL